METNNTYISFVIQSEVKHIHDFTIVKLPTTRIAIYSDNTSQEVIKWSIEKQKTLAQQDKLVILNYFNISNIE